MQTQSELTQIVKQRRDDVHRRIGELRLEIEVLEARADELERFWKELVAGPPRFPEVGVAYICQPKVAITASSGAGGLILKAMLELEEAGYEGADRAAILAIVRRDDSKMKPNTIRVAFRRLLKNGRIEKCGNLYSLPRNETAALEGAAA